MLRRIERNLESLVEGVFGRAFRSPVQPVELARKLAKEMDSNKAVSVSRVYAPNEYLLYLSPRDRAQYRQYEEALLVELSAYLIEHAQTQGYALLSRPRILVEEDADLRVGLFGIATRMVEPKRPPKKASTAAPPPPPPPPPAAHVAEDAAVNVEKAPPSNGPAAAVAAAGAGAAAAPFKPVIVGADKRHELAQPVTVLGRSQQCDLVIDDAGASRRHAEIRRADTVCTIVDLGSTNGVHVNGELTAEATLANGDVVSIGRTQLRFEC